MISLVLLPFHSGARPPKTFVVLLFGFVGLFFPFWGFGQTFVTKKYFWGTHLSEKSNSAPNIYMPYETRNLPDAIRTGEILWTAER